MGGARRICDVCVNTDFALALDPDKWDWSVAHHRSPIPNVVHQNSIASLRASALHGCPMCLFFMKLLPFPLRPQQPEPRSKFVRKTYSKKNKKLVKRAFDADRRGEEELGPCRITAILAGEVHEDYALRHGTVAGFDYGPENKRVRLGVMGLDSSPDMIGTRNPISKSGEGTEPRLVVTGGLKGQYVTLGHCWGENKPPKTTKANLSSHLTSMPSRLMPKTFQDAVNINRLLGYRYIWIDSSCIIQDDKTDWQRECASMAAIYSNCAFNLAAPFSKDCHSGFPRGLHPIPADTWYDIPNFWPGASSLDSIRVFYPYDSNRGQVDWDNSPLAGRAWVMQEHILSPRWLYFGPNSLYFTCQTAKFDEHVRSALKLPKNKCGRDEVFPSRSVFNFAKYEEGLLQWYMMTEAYSELRLTHGSDRLPALAGVASQFAARLHDECIAGLWRKDVASGLIFYLPARLTQDDSQRSMVPAPVPGPSWSWYSCDRSVRFPYNYPDRNNVDLFSSFDYRNLFVSERCFGPMIEVEFISATKLTILGRLQRAWCSILSKPKTYQRIGLIESFLECLYGKDDEIEEQKKRVWSYLFAPGKQEIHLPRCPQVRRQPLTAELAQVTIRQVNNRFGSLPVKSSFMSLDDMSPGIPSLPNQPSPPPQDSRSQIVVSATAKTSALLSAKNQYRHLSRQSEALLASARDNSRL
ncbi:hypothetical protein VTL71DRAFT_8444 [Oculimacula yallundae]|uniref:Heterokaryon incompatibility domain-containing protein n=1 Tax=Oculimacula yallundae TaxID=86028 RepID=A0ABR4CXM0_9HELO